MDVEHTEYGVTVVDVQDVHIKGAGILSIGVDHRKQVAGRGIVSQATDWQVYFLVIQDSAVHPEAEHVAAVIPRTCNESIGGRVKRQAAQAQVVVIANPLAGRNQRNRIYLMDAVVTADVNLPECVGKWIVSHIGRVSIGIPRSQIYGVAGLSAIGRVFVIFVFTAITACSDIANPRIASIFINADAPSIRQTGGPTADKFASIRRDWHMKRFLKRGYRNRGIARVLIAQVLQHRIREIAKGKALQAFLRSSAKHHCRAFHSQNLSIGISRTGIAQGNRVAVGARIQILKLKVERIRCHRQHWRR